MNKEQKKMIDKIIAIFMYGIFFPFVLLALIAKGVDICMKYLFENLGIEWALNQSDEIKNLIENNGYDKGFQDAIEKAKTIIINFMPLPSNKNHNINQDIDLLEERQKYAHQVAKKFEEMMNTDER